MSENITESFLLSRKGKPDFTFIATGEDIKKYTNYEYLDEYQSMKFLVWFNKISLKSAVYSSINDGKSYFCQCDTSILITLLIKKLNIPPQPKK